MIDNKLITQLLVANNVLLQELQQKQSDIAVKQCPKFTAVSVSRSIYKRIAEIAAANGTSIQYIATMALTDWLKRYDEE